MYTNLINHIQRFVSLNQDEIALLHEAIKPYNLKKKEHLLNEGQVCKHIYFVEKGCLRMYFINNKTTEQITQFALDGWWISDYFSLTDNTPSNYYIQAIEASEVLAIETISFEKLLKKLPQLERYFRLTMQRALAANQLRSKYLYEMSKEEFYQHFSNSFPEFIQRVPQYMVASYLGLTPEYLSELRKKKH